MIKLKLLITLLFSIGCLIAKSEIIKGIAVVRDKPNGKILFDLESGENVECGELKDGWYKISITVKITKQQYDEAYNLRKGDKLINPYNDKLIGVTVNDFPTELGIPESYGINGYDMEIFGYIPQSGIEKGSIPENVLNALF